ncbi:MAG: basic amino acid ABC transporter substrate-binding protein, partial [Clostridia bacterium]|nr:basic amino acid ABC transporter substrate-binding protein [Clostridia bacterium]
MKKIIKISAVILALVMALGSLCACGNGTSTENPSKTEKLVMATNASFPPYEYVDDSGAFA